MSDEKWKKIRANIRKSSDGSVRVGILGSSTYEGGLSIAEVGFIHEFGSEKANIPERSFLRSTFKNKAAEMKSFTTKLVSQITKGTLTAEKALGLLGQWGASQVRATIRASIDPPNSKATVAKKGSSTPLIDTGQLINSISYKVDP